mgnify:CR=1 FL=1
MNQILIICGPTATGKTKLAVSLAKKFNGGLISADSRQVYQGMDIVTGKDLPAGRQDKPAGVKIFGYDLVKPDEDFSVAHFINFAQPLIIKLQQQNRLPIIVGGTGLYINALLKPIPTLNIPPSPSLRRRLEKNSLKQLQTALKKLNPDRFNQMNHSDQNNPRRLIRAIEVAKVGSNRQSLNFKHDALLIGLTASVKILDQRIVDRVNQRIKAGARQEIESLLRQGYSKKLPSMSAIGYREWPDVAKWIQAEQQYSRRQLTWFKKIPGLHWFNINQPNFNRQLANLISAWYTK